MHSLFFYNFPFPIAACYENVKKKKKKEMLLMTFVSNVKNEN